MKRRAKLPGAQGLGAWDPSCRHTYCEEKADNHTLHTSPSTAPSSEPPPSTTVTHCAKSASLLDSLRGKLHLQDLSASRRPWTGPIHGLEHPRQAAFVRVFVEDDLTNPGTAFKFNFVDFGDSTATKKYVANVRPNDPKQKQIDDTFWRHYCEANETPYLSKYAEYGRVANVRRNINKKFRFPPSWNPEKLTTIPSQIKAYLNPKSRKVVSTAEAERK
ncbi:hypothetical protein FPHYL_3265 [Fusarium phyllophilum]|uniref:Uncharacterized protein n=1 Tax=Fusarium phyllophilum TaxID=47803 RepID=A0A8H5NJ84_9HYPO|nr:hypothetical protein FPHYL_3265 [Fusarium phyllophilum]